MAVAYSMTQDSKTSGEQAKCLTLLESAERIFYDRLDDAIRSASMFDETEYKAFCLVEAARPSATSATRWMRRSIWSPPCTMAEKQKQRKHNHSAKIYAVHLFGWAAFYFVNTAIWRISKLILPAVWYSAVWFPAVWYSVGSCTAVQIAYNGNWRTKKRCKDVFAINMAAVFVFMKQHEIKRNAKRIQEKTNEIRLRRIILAPSGLKSGQWDS